MPPPSPLFPTSQWESELLTSFEELYKEHNGEGVLQCELIAHVAQRFDNPVLPHIAMKARRVLKGMVQRGIFRQKQLPQKGKPIMYYWGTSSDGVPSDMLTRTNHERVNGQRASLIRIPMEERLQMVNGALLHTEKSLVHHMNLDDDFFELPADEKNDEHRISGNALDKYFRDIRKYPVQKRKKEIQWFTDLDGLYKKIIACIRLSNSARALARTCTMSAYLQDGSYDDDEHEEKRQEELEWLRFWWRIRDWQNIDRLFTLLKAMVGRNDNDHSGPDELSRTLFLLTPLYEKAMALRHEIAKHNLRLVIHCARIYCGSSMYGDVIQEGNKGLLRAIDKFVVTKGNKFVTYAVWWARQHIMRYAQQRAGVVTLSVHTAAYLMRMKKAQDRFLQTQGRYPSAEELACLLEVKIDLIRDLFAIAGNDVSFSQPVGPDRDTALEDFFRKESDEKPDALAKDNDRKKLVTAILNCLPKKLAVIMDIRCGLTTRVSHTLEETAEILVEYGHPHLSRERIRQLESEAKHKLMHNAHALKILKELQELESDDDV